MRSGGVVQQALRSSANLVEIGVVVAPGLIDDRLAVDQFLRHNCPIVVAGLDNRRVVVEAGLLDVGEVAFAGLHHVGDVAFAKLSNVGGVIGAALIDVGNVADAVLKQERLIAGIARLNDIGLVGGAELGVRRY